MSIVNVGQLAEPATVLIKKITGAVGAIFEPHQIKRIARAKADAAVIEAEGQIRVTDVHRRAMERFISEEVRKQENIEAITSDAIPQLEDNSKPQDVEDDWIANFFDKCRIISDRDMQQLWARVLSGEANTPGKFSKRTVNFLASLDKEDAVLFACLSSFVFDIIGDLVPLVFEVEDQVYANAGLTFLALTHLDSIGLIRFATPLGFVRKGLRGRTVVKYHGTPVLLEFSEDTDQVLDLGRVLFTQVGKQLTSISVAPSNPDFFGYVLDWWRRKGIVVASPYPKTA